MTSVLTGIQLPSAHSGGSRSLPESCVVTLRYRPAVDQSSAYVFLARGDKRLDNGPGSDEIPEPPDLTLKAERRLRYLRLWVRVSVIG